MSEAKEPILRIAPFVKGVATAERVVVRRANAPEYLNLTSDELSVVEDLVREPVSVSDFLGRHFGGHKNLDLKAAVSLVMRLHQAHFIADTTDEIARRLTEISGRGHGQAAGQMRRVTQAIKLMLDLPLVTYRHSEVHPIFRQLGRLIVSLPALVAYVAVLCGLSLYSGLATLPNLDTIGFEFDHPEMLLVKAFFSFSLAASWTAFLQMAALSGAGAKFVGGGLRITGFCVIRLSVNDQDALMLPKATLLRYHLVTLLSPWVSALVLWQLVDAKEFNSLAGLMTGTFVILGTLMLCPLYRSPLVKIAEGYLATLNFLARANAYLTRGMISSLLHSEKKTQDGKKAPAAYAAATQLWITAFACLSILWLYGMSLTFIDAMLGAVPALWVQVLSRAHLLRAVCSAVILLVMGLAVLVPVLSLVSIPFQNLAAVASMPIRRARRGLSTFYDKSLTPSAVISQFLREIPILAHLSEAELGNLTAALKYRRFGAGQSIITKGEAGSEFFILADGQAQVILGGDAAPEEVVDVLNPGDSFGEIALVEHVTRTATIRALSNCATFLLERQAFDALFPEGSESRQKLTSMIRQVKLVLESQALSHLAPRQIKELLATCRTVTYKEGDFLIKESTVGDHAFLIASGEVQVVKEQGSMEIARLGRGELVGAISLIKDIKRTASVRAVSVVTCLEIDKPTFLRMCMSNMFVALLVSDLSDRQLAQAKAS